MRWHKTLFSLFTPLRIFEPVFVTFLVIELFGIMYFTQGREYNDLFPVEVPRMHRQMAERLSSWKEIFWGKAMAIGGGVWLLIGAWDLIKSQFLPAQYQSWTVVAITPHLSGRTWVIVLLVLLLLILMEGAHAAIKKRDAVIAKSVSSSILAEEDPKIYFEPLNSDFITTGLIPFDMFNNGQRVNVAHRITVQPIALLPSVTFEYINHLEMNQHKKLLPLVSQGPDFPLGNHHNILPELEKAWQQRGMSGEVDAEFPFEIILNYQDVSGRKNFETKVSLVYSATEYCAATTDVLAVASSRQEFKIIRVVGMDVRRLS